MPLNQTGPSVDEMSQIIAEATRVRCVCPSERELLYETAEPEALAQLAAALRAQPPKGTYCMCVGTLLLELEGERAVVITLHHGESLRWNGSGGTWS